VTADQRHAHEEAALNALRVMAATSYGRDQADNGVPAVFVYGWATKPHPDDWTVRNAELACRRLERRGILTKVAGATAWKLST
jgi:hypothetical protein